MLDPQDDASITDLSDVMISTISEDDVCALDEKPKIKYHYGLGSFELMVMTSTAKLSNYAFGMEIYREVNRREQRPINFGTVYITLNRLEGKGLLSSCLGEPSHERGGRRKRYYNLTPRGKELVIAEYNRHTEIFSGLDYMLNSA